MRSTSFTIRSVSSQMRRVSARSSSPTLASSSCAAPRMPESGFLISCASMAPSAVTERAALRWVNLSVYFFGNCPFLQHDRDRAAWLRQRGDENVDTAPASRARRGNVELVAVDGRMVAARISDEPEHRRAERQKVGQARAQQKRRAPCRKNSRPRCWPRSPRSWPSMVISGCASAFRDLGRIGAPSCGTARSRGSSSVAAVEGLLEQSARTRRALRSSRARAGAPPARPRASGIGGEVLARVTQPGARAELAEQPVEMLDRAASRRSPAGGGRSGPPSASARRPRRRARARRRRRGRS